MSAALDLGPIEARRVAALATGEVLLGLRIGGTASLKALAESIARSAADVPDLIDEVKRLRTEAADADRLSETATAALAVLDGGDRT